LVREMPDMTSSERGPKSAVTGTVRGRVQGVGFRISAQWAAQRIGVTGWVRNLSDGRVEVFAQGDPDRLATFRAWLEVGPRAARVDQLTLTTVDVDPTLSDFFIR
jgi:acylphosphatase